MRIVLTVLTGPFTGLTREYSPAPARIRLGRCREAEFPLLGDDRKDLAISREHCYLEVSPLGCRIHDNGSNNHVKVNGKPVVARELTSGDRIRLSKSTQIQIDIFPEAAEQATILLPSALPEAGAISAESWFEVLPSVSCVVCTEPTLLRGDVCSICREKRNQEEQPIPDYLLLREIGRGGMGVVWLAEERATRRQVAIKWIRPEAGTSEAQVKRFLREIRYLHKLSHPNLVGLVPVELSEVRPDRLFFVMDYVPGVDGATFLALKGPLEPPLAVRIIRAVLAALEYAHGQGYIHRDLKPGNVLIVEEPWSVHLTDFGLAHHVSGSQSSRLTQSHEIGGTLPYLPPEQALGLREASFASDQYGAAATLYTLLTGATVHDFTSRDPLHRLDVIRGQPVVSILLRRPELSPALAAVIHRALKLDEEARYPSVQEFSQALAPFGR